MSDQEALKQILEDKARQSLREHLNEGKQFDTSSQVNQTVLNEYNDMNEDEKRSFRGKGWIND